MKDIRDEVVIELDFVVETAVCEVEEGGFTES